MAIKLVENWAVTMTRNSVRDSFQYHGEEFVALDMFHVNQDEGTQPRCPVCYDDIYMSNDQLCTRCYGTTFDGGVREAVRIWGMFSDHVGVEDFRQHGVWEADNREIQFEAFPELMEHDYIVRVRRWTPDHRPEELEGYYEVNQVTRQSMRTGSRFGQWDWDVVGQKAQCSEIQKNSIIWQYPVLGVQFPDSTSLEGIPPVPVPVVQPDSKLFYVYEPGTGPSPPPTNQMLSGTGPPSDSTGKPGDFYIDTDSDIIYGPKQE